MTRHLLPLALLWVAAARPAAAEGRPHAAMPAPARDAAAHAAIPAPARPDAKGQTPGGNVFESKHNLSVSGRGSIKAASETQVCIFCHVSHMGGTNAGNRPTASSNQLRHYSSSTMQSQPTTPARGTRSCLSCHDGTIAVGQTVKGRIQMMRDDHLSPTSSSNIGTDLRRTHPVAVRPGVSAKLKRFARDDAGRPTGDDSVECTSCHDPHRENADPTVGKFLLKSNRQSALCLSCHDLPGWTTSTHAASQRPTAAAQTPGPSYGTVAEDGCQSCHQNHGASDKGWLLRTRDGASDDDVCLRCHNGSVARQDIRAEVQKPVSHAARPGGPSGHDASEGRPGSRFRLPEASPAASRHATCADCHAPHAAQARPAVAPFASGALNGVWGIDRNGARVETVRYEYEICFKCHGDSANQPQARASGSAEPLRRRVTDVNLRRAFDPTSPSFHPVEAPGRSADVPSLIAPLTAASIIYCSDCHASDRAASGAPRGPHGSTYAHLLERNYATADHTPESAGAYALCYKCHDREVLLSDRSSFNLHRKHVVEQSAPCSACHNSHGVSSQNGTPANNAHLVDFDVSIVKGTSRGPELYATAGYRSGNCTLACHGKEHAASAYSPLATGAAALKLRAAQGKHQAIAAPASGGAALHRVLPAPARR